MLVAVGFGTVVAVTAIVTIWVLWPPSDTEPVRERRYRDTTACLLTDDKGLAGESAAAVWAGMREASTDTQIKIQHLAVSGPQNPANALTYYNSLASQNCTIFIAVGKVAVTAMTSGLSKFPQARHLAVGHDPGDPTVTLVEAASTEETRAAVRGLVSRAA
ncbi:MULTISPECIES: hypothetical protein [unclassified Micromonospora]|uniref:hypothetical protein n=1 Tax=unclassified Micromonospora TaxID=2617518 RepID=UPI00362667A9